VHRFLFGLLFFILLPFDTTLVSIIGVELLEFLAATIRALGVRLQRVLGEEVSESIVAQEVGRLSKLEQVFEYVLTQEACDDTHCSWQGSCTDSFSLDGMLIAVTGDNKRGSTRKAGDLTRHEVLDVAAHGVLTDTALEPNLIKLVARLVDAHAGRIVVDAGENKIHAAACK